MSKGYCITVILGCIVVYFLLVAFCLSQSLHPGVADDPTLPRKGKDGVCIGNGWSAPVDVERQDRLNHPSYF